jgi:hypothetical protein
MNMDRARFLIHKEPVWRKKTNAIIYVPIGEDDNYEQLWCRQIDECLFELCCIPFFLYDVALGDVMEVFSVMNPPYDSLPLVEQPYVEALVKVQSGRYVFRVFFEKSKYNIREHIAGLLSELGAVLEWSSMSMLAVDVKEKKQVKIVADFLHEYESRGDIIYETGKTNK